MVQGWEFVPMDRYLFGASYEIVLNKFGTTEWSKNKEVITNGRRGDLHWHSTQLWWGTSIVIILYDIGWNVYISARVI